VFLKRLSGIDVQFGSVSSKQLDILVVHELVSRRTHLIYEVARTYTSN